MGSQKRTHAMEHLFFTFLGFKLFSFAFIVTTLSLFMVFSVLQIYLVCIYQYMSRLSYFINGMGMRVFQNSLEYAHPSITSHFTFSALCFSPVTERYFRPHPQHHDHDKLADRKDIRHVSEQRGRHTRPPASPRDKHTCINTPTESP